MQAVRTGHLMLGLLLAACAEPLDAPSAYEDQAFLCGEEGRSAREAESSACRSSPDCIGWVSFRGTLQAQPVTVGSPLRSAALDLHNDPIAGLVRESIELNADSPYFNLRLVFSALPVATETTQDLELPISARDGSDHADASLRMRGGGASVELSGRDGLLQTSWTLHEQVGEAHLDFGSDNVVDACFFARTSVEARQ